MGRRPLVGRYMYTLLSLSALVLLAFPILAWAEESAQVPVKQTVAIDRLPEIAKLVAAKAFSVPPQDLELVHSAVASFPLKGETASTFKFIDKRSGTIHGLALDGNGRVVDLEQWEAEERVAHAAKYGRLDPKLAERIATAPPDQPIEVFIWLKEPPYAGPAKPDPKQAMTQDEADMFLKQVDTQRAAAVEQVVTPVADRLRSMGHEVMTYKHSPMVSAHLKPADIRQLAEWPQVDRIYEAGYSEPELDVARSTIGADAVNARGYTGSGVSAAQIEIGARIATDNPYLAGVIQDTTYVCAQPNRHSTGVAGVIRSTHTSIRGIASGVSLWAGGSCTGNNAELANRSLAAADWGARALNLSWGSDTGLTLGSMDRFYDDMVINRYRTIVKSAGNRGTGDGNITSPGLAYNVITVGNFNDRNTIAWDDYNGPRKSNQKLR